MGGYKTRIMDLEKGDLFKRRRGKVIYCFLNETVNRYGQCYRVRNTFTDKLQLVRRSEDWVLVSNKHKYSNFKITKHKFI